MTTITAAILMKPLSRSKSRLASVLSGERRALLSLAMLAGVVAAAREARNLSEVVVYGGDRAVRRLCAAVRVEWREEGAPGLNPALSSILSTAAAGGRDAVLYLPADLPLLQSEEVDDLVAIYEPGSLVLAPDRHEQGTNALIAGVGAGFQPSLGAASLQRHMAQAGELGLEARCLRAPGFLLDVDEPPDLDLLLQICPSWWREAEAAIRALESSGPAAAEILRASTV